MVRFIQKTNYSQLSDLHMRQNVNIYTWDKYGALYTWDETLTISQFIQGIDLLHFMRWNINNS